MTIGLRDIRFKPLIVLFFLTICLLMVDGINRIEKKLVIKAFYQQAPDGLGGTIIYLQKDGTLASTPYCDICNDTLINGTWNREKDLLILRFDNDTTTESLFDYNDSLVYKNGVTAYYNINFQRIRKEKK
jgi:hypothetical protein